MNSPNRVLARLQLPDIRLESLQVFLPRNEANNVTPCARMLVSPSRSRWSSRGGSSSRSGSGSRSRRGSGGRSRGGGLSSITCIRLGCRHGRSLRSSSVGSARVCGGRVHSGIRDRSIRVGGFGGSSVGGLGIRSRRAVRGSGRCRLRGRCLGLRTGRHDCLKITKSMGGGLSACNRLQGGLALRHAEGVGELCHGVRSVTRRHGL
jgi:hypothetical protein